MQKLILKDSGNNRNFEIEVDGQKLNLRHCTGYELKRTADKEKIELKVIYAINKDNCFLNIKNNNTKILTEKEE